MRTPLNHRKCAQNESACETLTNFYDKMLRSDEIFGILMLFAIFIYFSSKHGVTERSYDVLLFFIINIYEKTFADFNLVCADCRMI